MAQPAAEVSATLDVIGQTPGAILYRGPEAWEILPPGTPGQVLTINSAGMPEWQDPT